MRRMLPVLLGLALLLSQCQKTSPVPAGQVYIQYEQAIDGFRDLKESFTLNDYQFARRRLI